MSISKKCQKVIKKAIEANKDIVTSEEAKELGQEVVKASKNTAKKAVKFAQEKAKVTSEVINANSQKAQKAFNGADKKALKKKGAILISAMIATGVVALMFNTFNSKVASSDPETPVTDGLTTPPIPLEPPTWVDPGSYPPIEPGYDGYPPSYNPPSSVDVDPEQAARDAMREYCRKTSGYISAMGGYSSCSY
jgi:hypothetical protein